MTQQTSLSNLGITTIHNCRSDQIGGGTAIFSAPVNYYALTLHAPGMNINMHLQLKI